MYIFLAVGIRLYILSSIPLVCILYIYTSTYYCVCVCVCVYELILSFLSLSLVLVYPGCTNAILLLHGWNHDKTFLLIAKHPINFSFCLFVFYGISTFVLWIELPWPKNPANLHARHMVTLDSCFDLIRSHQQCILWFPPLEIEQATTDCRDETLQLSQ